MKKAAKIGAVLLLAGMASACEPYPGDPYARNDFYYPNSTYYYDNRYETAYYDDNRYDYRTHYYRRHRDWDDRYRYWKDDRYRDTYYYRR